jgi:hypothetical protein
VLNGALCSADMPIVNCFVKMKVDHQWQMITSPPRQRCSNYARMSNEDSAAAKRFIERTHRQVGRERAKTGNRRRDLPETMLVQMAATQSIAPIVVVTNN